MLNDGLVPPCKLLKGYGTEQEFLFLLYFIVDKQETVMYNNK